MFFSEQWSSFHSGPELKLTLYENYSVYHRKTITFHSISLSTKNTVIWHSHTQRINVRFILFTNLENLSKQTACQRVVCISSTRNYCTPFIELNKQNYYKFPWFFTYNHSSRPLYKQLHDQTSAKVLLWGNVI